MFDTFKEQIEKGTEVQLWLITGKEVTGTVAEIGNTYVVISTKEGQVTDFDKLLGGWEIKTSEGISINLGLPREQSCRKKLARLHGF